MRRTVSHESVKRSGVKPHGATPAQFTLEDFVQFGQLRMISYGNQTGRPWGLRRQEQLAKSIV